MEIIINQDRLDQMAQYINEMPTKWGFPLAVLLNNWRNEAIQGAQLSNTEAPPPAQE